MVAVTARRLAERKAARSPDEVARASERSESPRGFRARLTGDSIALIAEFKRRSPSAGTIAEGRSIQQVCTSYEGGGAAAISVLTDEDHFGGSLHDLETARRSCELPLLRKDFCIDSYQLYEARVAGADAVLLIVACLSQRAMVALFEKARELGLDVLVEVHDASELERALELDCDLIGVNNRDLRDLSVDLATTFSLLAQIPAGVTVVSESGIDGPAQVAELERAGVSAVLVGESLMRAGDPQAACRALRSGSARL